MPSNNQKMESAKILSDQSITTPDSDLFNFSIYANTLTQTILNAETPITFGIFGKWGTGKTSLMRLLYTNLCNKEEERKVFPVWFEAWRFENEANLIIPLLYTIRDEIRHRNPNRISNNRYENISKTLDELTRALASGVEVSTKIGETTISYKAKDSLEAAKNLKAEHDKSSLTDTGKSPYYDLFYYLREQIKDLHPTRFIIFVDDLDRCQPDKALSILEAMKLTMNIEGIVFVIAAEREILGRITEQAKYGQQNFVDGNSFLKKIIQVFFNLPPLTEQGIEKYVKNLMDRSGVLKIISEKERLKIVKMIGLGAESNPREIKRLINNFSILYSLASTKTKPNKVALMLVIQQRWPLIFQNILSNQNSFIEFGQWVHQDFADTGKEQILIDWKVYFKSLSSNVKKIFALLGVDLSFLEFIRDTMPDMDFSVAELSEFIYFSEIGSMAMVGPDDLKFIQIIEVEKKDKKRWTVQADAPDSILDRIEKITFTLPATIYPQHQRTTTRQDGFYVSDVGNINIPIYIKVFMKNGSTLPYTHNLNLAG